MWFRANSTVDDDDCDDDDDDGKLIHLDKYKPFGIRQRDACLEKLSQAGCGVVRMR